MVARVVSSEGDVVLPHAFAQGLIVNAAAYKEILEKVVRLWIDRVRNGKPYIFQQRLFTIS